MKFSVTKTPKFGDKRVRRVFAWLPTRMTHPSTIVLWLEYYLIYEFYDTGFPDCGWEVYRREPAGEVRKMK